MPYVSNLEDIEFSTDLVLKNKTLCNNDNQTKHDIILEEPVLLIDTLNSAYFYALINDCFPIFWVIQDLINKNLIETDNIKILVIDNNIKNYPTQNLPHIDEEKKTYKYLLKEMIQLVTSQPVIFQHLSDKTYLIKKAFTFLPGKKTQYHRSFLKYIEGTNQLNNEVILVSLMRKFREQVFNKMAVMKADTDELIIINSRGDLKFDSDVLTKIQEQANKNTRWTYKGVVYLEDLTLKEQVNLFNKSRFIICRISICVPNLANILWCQANAIIFGITDTNEISKVTSQLERICEPSDAQHVILDHKYLHPQADIFELLLSLNSKHFSTHFLTYSEVETQESSTLLKSIQEMGLFNKCTNATLKDTENLSKKPSVNPLWMKSYFIKTEFDNMKDGDVLLYLDPGCTIDTDKKDAFKHYIDLVRDEMMIFTTTVWREEYCTKMDLFRELGALNEKYTQTRHRHAGFVIYLVNEKTRKFVNTWYELSCKTPLLDDSPSMHKESDAFKTHKNDHSIFSLLTKLHNFNSTRSIHTIVNAYRSNQFDVVIPVGPKDVDFLDKNIEYIRKNIVGFRNIYLITFDKTKQIPGCITIGEDLFPFSKDTVDRYHGKTNRSGWYLQQLLKLYAGFVIPNILDTYLVIDCDSFFLKPTRFIDSNGRCCYCYASTFWEPYFKHMSRLHYSLEKVDKTKSGICHHMIFQKKYIKELFELVESNHEEGEFYDIFLSNVSNNKKETMESGASEYEIYFNFMLKNHPEEINIRELKWDNTGILNTDSDKDYISVHWWMRK